MWGKAAVLTVGAALCASCQSFPDEPSRTLTYPVAYAALADCIYLKIEPEGFWRNEDLPSVQTSRLIKGHASTQIGRIDVVGVGANQAKVDMRFQTPVQGKDHFPNIYQPIVEACATTAATVAPAA